MGSDQAPTGVVMTLDLEALAVRCADEQLKRLYEAGEKRVYCRCGCGAWWLRRKSKANSRQYLNPKHRKLGR
jgi:hypothetical protein